MRSVGVIRIYKDLICEAGKETLKDFLRLTTETTPLIRLVSTWVLCSGNSEDVDEDDSIDTHIWHALSAHINFCSHNHRYTNQGTPTMSVKCACQE
ncbi:hypothetical protein Sjap_015851 [Stephania japonica]|uniref:Uncharacterized protein n=1 Tax=Stephania japonica TaxID=461633 RepID=A0AAP0NSX6_9MAGN